MIEQQIAEATECDFKVALETQKPKSWLKSVSAFSNGIGGTLFFGISDDYLMFKRMLKQSAASSKSGSRHYRILS